MSDATLPPDPTRGKAGDVDRLTTINDVIGGDLRDPSDSTLEALGHELECLSKLVSLLNRGKSEDLTSVADVLRAMSRRALACSWNSLLARANSRTADAAAQRSE